nr:AraC family transcriptional regulator [Paenibacillus polysaccharolyticus]
MQGKSSVLISPENHLFFYEIFDPVTVICHNTSKVLNKHDIIIGSKVKILNNCENNVKIKGLNFEFYTSKSNLKKPIYIFNNISIINQFHEIWNFYAAEQDSNIDLSEIKEKIKLLISLIECDSDNEHQSKSKIGKIHTKLIKINRYLRNNYHEPITLQQLSDLFQCNSVYLCNTYSKVFKISPVKYLKNLRMEKAKNLIMNTNEPIKSVASKVGYVSCAHFCEVFKKYYNSSPTEYRKKITYLKMKGEIKNGESEY